MHVRDPVAQNTCPRVSKGLSNQGDPGWGVAKSQTAKVRRGGSKRSQPAQEGSQGIHWRAISCRKRRRMTADEANMAIILLMKSNGWKIAATASGATSVVRTPTPESGAGAHKSAAQYRGSSRRGAAIDAKS